MITRLSSVVVNVSDIDGTTDFWGKMLQPQFKLVYRDDNSSTFHPTSGDGIALAFSVNNQTHFDFDTGPWPGAEAHAAEVSRIVDLGAQRVVDWPRPGVVVLTDPSGLRFCVC